MSADNDPHMHAESTARHSSWSVILTAHHNNRLVIWQTYSGLNGKPAYLLEHANSGEPPINVAGQTDLWAKEGEVGEELKDLLEHVLAV